MESDIQGDNHAVKIETWTCQSCGVELDISQRVAHLTSISHQVQAGVALEPNHILIPPNNLGYQLLVGLGWNEGTGLGKFEQGRRDPIATSLCDRSGLGAKPVSVRITHFPSHTTSGALSQAALAAIDPRQRVGKRLTKPQRKQMKRRLRSLEQQLDQCIREALR